MTKHDTAPERRLRAELLEALPRLRRFARGLTGNPADADDLVQATAEKVLVAGVPEDVDVLRWMFKVCRNQFIDQLRSSEVRRRAPDPPDLTEQPTISGEDVAIGEITLAEVELAMAALSAEQREVLMLITVEGMAYKEAAAVLDVPIGTVMSRLARARAALAARFSDDAEPGAIRHGEETRHG